MAYLDVVQIMSRAILEEGAAVAGFWQQWL